MVGRMTKAGRGSTGVWFSTTCGMDVAGTWTRTRSPSRKSQPGDLVAVVEGDVD
jgi:ribosomal protein L37AE/L43A